MLENINHNKYAKKNEYKEDTDPQFEAPKYQDQDYDDGEGESSPCSCSYWFRKEQGKGGIEDLIAMHGDDQNDSNTHSFHSSILHENRDKFKNIRELRRLYEVMKSYGDP